MAAHTSTQSVLDELRTAIKTPFETQLSAIESAASVTLPAPTAAGDYFVRQDDIEEDDFVRPSRRVQVYLSALENGRQGTGTTTEVVDVELSARVYAGFQNAAEADKLGRYYGKAMVNALTSLRNGGTIGGWYGYRASAATDVEPISDSDRLGRRITVVGNCLISETMP